MTCILLEHSGFFLTSTGDYLMIPFRDNGRLTVPRRYYNGDFLTSRQNVERVIDLLKCRFRRLTSLPCLDVERSCKVITGCCVLHNICILSNDSVNDLLDDLPLNINANNYEPLYGNVPLGVHLTNQVVQYRQTLQNVNIVSNTDKCLKMKV